jgi:hypothetical protein
MQGVEARFATFADRLITPEGHGGRKGIMAVQPDEPCVLDLG